MATADIVDGSIYLHCWRWEGREWKVCTIRCVGFFVPGVPVIWRCGGICDSARLASCISMGLQYRGGRFVGWMMTKI